jgi:Domain of unknown function (DUF4166)
VSSKSLYQEVMGPGFLLLPVPVQQFHALQGTNVLHGRVEVQAPATFAARCLARCLGAPLTTEWGPIRFELESDSAAEHWVRHFPGKTMQSRLGSSSGHIVEQLGAARLTFALRGSPEMLEMQLVGLRFLGVPCPRWLLPSVVAEETATSGRLHFRVQASVRFIGTVAGYQGYLELPSGKSG